MQTLKLSRVWPVFLLVGANLLIVSTTMPGVRYAAALIMLAFLPGWGWLQLCFTKTVDLDIFDLIERVVMVVGLSLALTIFAAMFTVYLPGAINLQTLLIVINLITLPGLLATALRKKSTPSYSVPTYTSVLLFALLILLAASLRLPRLGYAEFHEDEAEALMLGSRLFQGEDYALFLHRKGPAQMLVPVTFWLFTDNITESMARFPFALSSILSVATIFFMAKRWFNLKAGFAAGLLWAINGYAIGFGRMVQYQALIFFMTPLAIYYLYLAWKQEQPRLQIPAAILLAASLLAHFDTLLLLPAAGYMGWIVIKKPMMRPAAVSALVLFLLLPASFYIPYLLDPEFSNTVTYLSESRVKPGLLYNNLNLLQRLDEDYSSRFYLPLVVIGIIGFIFNYLVAIKGKNPAIPNLVETETSQVFKTCEVWNFNLTDEIHPKSNFFSLNLALIVKKYFLILTFWFKFGIAGKNPIRLTLQFLLALLTASTFWLPGIWHVGQVSLAILPWLLLGGMGFWYLPSIESKISWVMFGSGFIGYLFLVDDPRTHLYIIYPGAVLLSGTGWMILSGKQVGWLGKLTFAILTVAVITYNTTIFLRTESNLDHLRSGWDGSIWEVAYNNLPKKQDYFGYPKREGWKTIGALRASGQFPGDFRSVNEDFIIPIWYNYGQARSCYNTPSHFFVRVDGERVPIEDKNYIETGRVEREGQVRLRIFSAKTEGETSPVYSLKDFEASFDQLASPQQFAKQAKPSQQMNALFGQAIQFTGIDLPNATVSPGGTIYLNLYWQALEKPDDNYRVFVHLTDGSTLWGQQDDNPVCRLPTSVWRAGQTGLGQFRLPVDPNTPPGRYPLVIGLYRADSMERLKITAGAGQPGDDFLWLGDIEVTE